MESLPPFMD
ncbi:hypothetical protein A2U01_0093888, partial [Trifolium medium]|nr:hypothetical protein [Trifolium medium]